MDFIGKGSFGEVYLTKYDDTDVVFKIVENKDTEDTYLNEFQKIDKYGRIHCKLLHIISYEDKDKYKLSIQQKKKNQKR